MNWISVKDRLPELEVAVLVYDGSNVDIAWPTGFRERYEQDLVPMWNYNFCQCCYYPEEPTHWMPLPKGPNENE